MGAWGAGTLENDAAEHWLGELKAAARDGRAAEALGDAIEPFADPALGVIEAEEAQRVVAAAEIIAALIGRPAPALPPPVRQWLERQDASLGETARALEPTALAALSRVKTASELHRLWAESDHLAQFEGAIDELHERLRGQA